VKILCDDEEFRDKEESIDRAYKAEIKAIFIENMIGKIYDFTTWYEDMYFYSEDKQHIIRELVIYLKKTI
jgi:hypothetical protein